MTLPPGQRLVEGFPRFGGHLNRPPPAVPSDPVIEITGAGAERIEFRVADLATLPRRAHTADFHCVAGWTATGIHWEGVAFRTFHETVIEPARARDTEITHFVFQGLDRYRSVVLAEDALADDVLLADRLNGRPLDGDHGAPVRLLSPSQYGFVSTKHLCRIELHTSPPSERYHPSPLIQAGITMFKPHRRARVWEEERHRYLPAWVVRPLYHRLIGPIRAMSARRGDNAG